MRIYDSIRAHFALRVGGQLHTLAHNRPFTIEHVAVSDDDRATWIIYLRNRAGNSDGVYITDLLRAYTLVVSRSGWTTRADIEALSLVRKFSASYILTMLATFDDIEARTGHKAAIRFIEPINV